jgi:hypothetical protein
MNKVGVIIVSYNSRPYLDGLFASLARVNYPSWEIIFINNASPDDSEKYVREKFLPQFSNLTIINSEKNEGFAGGNNIGFGYLAEKNFDFAYLLNQDTEVNPDFLEKAVATAGEGTGSVQSLIYLYGPERKINSLNNAVHYLGFGYCYGYGWNEEKAKKYLADWRARDPELKIAYASGAGVLYNIKALKETGFFEEDYFMYHEDLDLGWRLRLAGYKNVLALESVIYHKYEFSKSIKKYYWMERNRYITIFKNYSAWTLALILPVLIIMETGLFVFSVFSGWRREKLRVYGYLLKPKNWRRIASGRRKIEELRKVSDREIAKNFTGKILFQDMDNWILRKIANPIFDLYWKIIKHIL